MSDNRCYTVVEFDKWKSHSEITNKNNHNFRVNPVAVLRPDLMRDNEVMQEPDSHIKERWLALVKILNEEMKASKEKASGMRIDEYKKLVSNDTELRESFIEKAREAGYAVDDKHAREMILLAAEGIDLSRYYDNQNLTGGRTNFIDQFQDKLAQHGITKIRKNAVMEIGVVMKVTKGFENLPDGFDLEKWKADSMKWLEDNFGKENILSAVYHGDEFTPHIQASVIPITQDGRLSAKDFLPDWTAYSQAQDTYYEAVKQDGLYRGIKGGQPGFEDQRRAHNALVAAGDIDLPEPKWGEKVEEYHVRANEAFKESGMQAYLRTKEAERELLLKISKLQASLEEAQNNLSEARKKEKSAREKARILTAESNFYREQLQGSGATTRELKDAAAVAAKLKEEHEREIKELKIKEQKAQEKAQKAQQTIQNLEAENTELQARVGTYEKILVDGKISPAALNNNMLVNYISYAFENGYPRAKETQKEMQQAYMFGKNLQERQHVISRENDDI